MTVKEFIEWLQTQDQGANALIFQSSTHYAALVAETCRPSVIFKPKFYIDGNSWCALYGDNLQDGVAGFGDSPELAASNFDFEWHAKLSSKVRVIAESNPKRLPGGTTNADTNQQLSSADRLASRLLQKLNR